MSFTIAIDGPAAAGKGTISKALASHFSLAHLDTGLLYRAVGAQVLVGANPLVAAKSLHLETLEASTLRSPEVALAASKVAVLADVRNELLVLQRSFARRPGGAVLDGRDIGTVICPEAEVKLFVTASAVVRAGRRYEELRRIGTVISTEQVLADVLARDARDTGRAIAPMVPAEDAVVIDTSDLAIEEAVAEAIVIVQKAREL
ncbi:MAG: d(CMP) kinase [Planktomarina sp.]|nr:d(CMP) kinase [Planktomarina sp.]